jgi:hypothetical protein
MGAAMGDVGFASSSQVNILVIPFFGLWVHACETQRIHSKLQGNLLLNCN